MYKIKPYSEYIQSELIQFLSAEPNQWQAKVIACLGFKVIYSFEEITKKLSLSPVYILKTLLIAEKYRVVTYTNEGWIINSRLDVNDLNDFLALDIADCDIGNSKRMSYLLKYGFLSKKEKDANKLATTDTEQQPGNIMKNKPSMQRKLGANSFDDYTGINERPVDGSGRKKSKEWNSNNALELQRSLRGIINEKNSNAQSGQISTKKKPTTHKRLSGDEYKAEKLYV